MRHGIEERFGEARFKSLLKSMDIPSISRLICDHKITEEEKSRCEACRRAIYRAKQRLEAAEKQDKTFEPINEFYNIPEIIRFIEYCKAKHVHDRSLRSCLFRMWQWIREAKDKDGNPINELIQTQRPILWNLQHIEYILPKIDEMKVSRYGWIQALRRFFESAKRHDMLKETLLRARRKDLRSPNGSSRAKDRFTAEEFYTKILPLLTKDEAFTIKMHVTLKSREGDRKKGSLLDLKWQDINWNDNFYNLEMVTASVFEPKTGGGTRWEHCPVDLWFADLSRELKERFDQKQTEYVFSFTYEEYRQLWNKISDALDQDFEAHDCRRSPSGWLRDLGLSDLAIGHYDPRTGRGTGYAGVGWENAEIFFQRYGKMNPAAIYDKKQRIDTSMFNGLINKIIAQRQ